jgi:hypothetical protein
MRKPRMSRYTVNQSGFDAKVLGVWLCRIITASGECFAITHPSLAKFE